MESRPSFIRADSLGGAYAFWDDLRAGVRNVYAQRLLPGGYYTPGWDHNGMHVLGFPSYDGTLQGLAPDGSGGWYVGAGIGLSGGASEEVLLQRLQPNGLPAPGWPSNGLFVSAVAFEGNGTLASDGSGGVYDAWDINVTSSTPNVRITRVLGTGVLANGWTQPGGMPVCSLQGTQSVPVCVPDDSGGVFVGWIDGRSGYGDIYCQRLHPDASFAPGWPGTGLPVSTAFNSQGSPFLGVTDRAGGVYFAWADFRNEPTGYVFEDDIYMARVRPDGSMAPGFPVDGLPVAVLDQQQFLMDLQSDPAGNAFLCWADNRLVNPGVYVQKIQPDGTVAPGWPVNGLKASTLADYQYPGAIVPDGSGGLYVTLMGYNTFVVYVQHLLSNGQAAPGWSSAGLPVTNIHVPQGYPAICSDGAGGCIVEWLDNRSGTDPVDFAQHFSASGPTPVELSLVSATATPESVQLEWYAASGNLLDPKVERRTASTEWTTVGSATIDGTGHIRYTDATVIPGTRYAYRLVLGDAALSTSSEVWVEVPAARFALEGLRPNPGTGSDLRVAFSLARAGTVQLELLDISGRRIASQTESQLEAGSHTLRPFQERIPPGLYWIRLTQGDQRASARAVVIQ